MARKAAAPTNFLAAMIASAGRANYDDDLHCISGRNDAMRGQNYLRFGSLLPLLLLALAVHGILIGPAEIIEFPR